MMRVCTCRSIGDNQLVFTSGMFSRFSNLTTLLLDNNPADTLPAGLLSGLSKLEVLYVLCAEMSACTCDVRVGLWYGMQVAQRAWAACD